MYTCETGMKAAIMKSNEPTRRKAAATRSELIEALVALPPAGNRRGGRISPLYHATRRTSAHLCLFTEVPRETVWKIAEGVLDHPNWVLKATKWGSCSPFCPLVEALTRAYPEFPNSFRR